MKLLYLKLKKPPKNPKKAIKIEQVDADSALYLVRDEDVEDPEDLAKDTDAKKRDDLDPSDPFYKTRALVAVPSGMFGLWPHSTERGVVIDSTGEIVLAAAVALEVSRG